jgi:drug/metabolite transporter (DMT)-like permease
MIGMYGVANLLQSRAVVTSGSTTLGGFDPTFLVRLARRRIYLLGLLCQMSGFVLAFLARRELPLFLVQSAVTAGLGVTAILGVTFFRWRLPRVEIILLLLLGAGLAALVVAAEPHPSRPLGLPGVIGLVVLLAGIGVAGIFAARMRGVAGSAVLGALAGVAFAAAAIASRPLASVHSWTQFGTSPLLFLVLANSLVGQLLLGLAMQRGSTTTAVAAMDAAAAVPAAIVGILFLGDRIAVGLSWLAVSGFIITLGSVIGLSFFAEPQHHHEHLERRRKVELITVGHIHVGSLRRPVRRTPPRTPSRTRSRRGSVDRWYSARAPW